MMVRDLTTQKHQRVADKAPTGGQNYIWSVRAGALLARLQHRL